MARSAKQKSSKRTHDSSPSPSATRSPKRHKRRGRPPKRVDPATAPDKFYPARSILDEDSSARKYLVEWEGLDPDTGKPFEPTWEHFEFCTGALIDEWEQQKHQAEQLHCGTDSDQQGLFVLGSQGPIPLRRNRITRPSSSPSLSEPPSVVPCASPVVIPSPLTTSQLLKYQYISSQDLSPVHAPKSTHFDNSDTDLEHQRQPDDVFGSASDTPLSSTVWDTPPRPRQSKSTVFVSDSQSWGVPSDHVPSTQPSLGDVDTADKRTTSDSQLSCPFAGAESGLSLQHCLLNSSALIPETQLLADTQESHALVSSGINLTHSPNRLPVLEDSQELLVGRASIAQKPLAAACGISTVGQDCGNNERQFQPTYSGSSLVLGLGPSLEGRFQVLGDDQRSTTQGVFPEPSVEDSVGNQIRTSSPKLDNTDARSRLHPSLDSGKKNVNQSTRASQLDLSGAILQGPINAAERIKGKEDYQSGQFVRKILQTTVPTIKSNKLREVGRSYASSSCATGSQKPEGTPRPNPEVINLTQCSELETRFSTFEPEVDLNEPRPSLSVSLVTHLPDACPTTTFGPSPSLQRGRLDAQEYATNLPCPGAPISQSPIVLEESTLLEAFPNSPPRCSQHLSGDQSDPPITDKSAFERNVIPRTIFGQTRSQSGLLNLRNKPSPIHSGLEPAPSGNLDRFEGNPSQDQLSTSESAPKSTTMSCSPSHTAAQPRQDIPNPHEIDTAQSESTRQHDSSGDTEMPDVEGAVPNEDEGHEDVDMEALVDTPYTAQGEYLVGLSMEGVQGNQYRTTMNFESKKIIAFTESDSQEAEAMAKEAKDLLTDVRNILTHVDLHFRSADALTQHENSDIEAAEWSKNAAAKFRFLGHLFERLRWETWHVVLISRPGEIQKIVETFVKGSKIQYTADKGGGDDPSAFKPQTDWPHGKLLVTILNSESEVSALNSADLMISLDPTLKLDTDRIWSIRNVMEVEPGALLPVITPIITNSLEHIDRCIPPAIQGTRRMQLLVRSMAELRNRAGRVDEGSMVDGAADAVAQALAAKQSTDEEVKKGFNTLTTVGSVRDLVNSKGGSISPLSISSANLQSTSETPGPSKRQLEDGKEEPSKRLKVNEAKANTKSKHQTLREDLAYTKHRLEEYEKALEACQATNEDQKDVILGLRQELSDNKTEVAKASEHIEKQTDIISKLKEEKVTLEESLAEARTALETSAIPEIAQQERVRRERDEALRSVEKLKRAQENQSREMDFVRDQYQSASSSAAECSAEKNSLTQQVRDLQRIVASEMERAKKLTLSSANKAWRDEVEKLQAQLRDRDEMIRRQSEEIKTMRPRQGVGTRAGSVPRSPRIMGGGPGSRGGSPAPSGLGGRVERLRNLNA